MHRLFVAIELPLPEREELRRLCHGVPGAKWAELDQLHLTLRFVGEVDGATFDDIAQALAGVRAEAFDIRLEGVGHFPPRGSARNLWVGVASNERLVTLRNRVEAAITGAGLKPDGRKFHPHVTLARLKASPGARVARYLAEQAGYRTGPIRVGAFHLFSSHLGQRRATYRIEATYRLEGSPGDEAP
jgi:2'-5' RNA ligase